ncbi:hypothetical protein Tco_0790619 [Tanacetum coccineum]
MRYTITARRIILCEMPGSNMCLHPHTSEKDKIGNNGDEKKWEKDPYNIKRKWITRMYEIQLKGGQITLSHTELLVHLSIGQIFPNTPFEIAQPRASPLKKHHTPEMNPENEVVGLATTNLFQIKADKFPIRGPKELSTGVSLPPREVRKCGGRLGHNQRKMERDYLINAFSIISQDTKEHSTIVSQKRYRSDLEVMPQHTETIALLEKESSSVEIESTLESENPQIDTFGKCSRGGDCHEKATSHNFGYTPATHQWNWGHKDYQHKILY